MQHTQHGSESFAREAWLAQAVTILRNDVIPQHYAPPSVWASVGFPKGSRKKAIGQCWSPANSEDGISHIFISPVLDVPERILDVLLHEIGHSIIQRDFPEAKGHGKEFRDYMKHVGLAGKPTATEASPELLVRLQTIAAQLGPYSHGKLSDCVRAAKEGTRLLKCECAACGYTVRVTRKWLNDAGAPLCPCNTEPMQTD